MLCQSSPAQNRSNPHTLLSARISPTRIGVTSWYSSMRTWLYENDGTCPPSSMDSASVTMSSKSARPCSEHAIA